MLFIFTLIAMLVALVGWALFSYLTSGRYNFQHLLGQLPFYLTAFVIVWPILSYAVLKLLFSKEVPILKIQEGRFRYLGKKADFNRDTSVDDIVRISLQSSILRPDQIIVEFSDGKLALDTPLFEDSPKLLQEIEQIAGDKIQDKASWSRLKSSYA